MRKKISCLLPMAALPLLAAVIPVSPAVADAVAATPGDIIAAAPDADWVTIAARDLVVMDLAADAAGRARRVVIQLLPAPFSQGWVGNIRKLIAARWFDGIAVVRVQDNYVVQWGDPEGEVPGKAKPLPGGLLTMGEADYTTSLGSPTPAKADAGAERGAGAPMRIDTDLGRFATFPAMRKEAYAAYVGFHQGWAFGMGRRDTASPPALSAWPIHCYGMVGVGRNISPDTGTGAELYTVIGEGPRQLDRNIALVGRVIAGIEHLSALPRGTGELGFYETAGERTPIVAVRMGDEVADLPAFEYLSTDSDSFAAYVEKRANRKDDFYIRPAGGVTACNVPVPIRRR